MIAAAVLAADVGDGESVRSAEQDALRHFGKLDILTVMPRRAL